MKKRNMNNKLYVIGIKLPLKMLSNKVYIDTTFTGFQQLIGYGFWENICFIEYDRDTKEYTIEEFEFPGTIPQYKKFHTEALLFAYMDEHEILFVNDCNPLGAIFQSYSAAYLEVVRWGADIAYTRKYLNNLMEG